MSFDIDNILLVGSILLIISIFAGKTTYRFGVPTLLLFLLIGMLAGTEGIGGVEFADPQLAQFIGIVALNFILFSGGFDTKWNAIKPILAQGATLSIVGVLLTAITLGGFIYYITDFTIYEALLLGSIVSSTDAAAVFSILRSRSLALKPHLRPTLELESGSNDPMAYVLTIAFTSLVINQDQSIQSLIPMLLQQIILGTILGLVMGRISRYIINEIKLDYEGLYPVLVVALMFATYSLTAYLNGNGFLAVYLSALYLGNVQLIHRNTLMRFFDGQAWLMQIILFLTLGLLVFPSQILPIVGIGIAIAAFLILIARPVVVFLTMIPFRIGWRKKMLISWVGLRGAVPIVFATFPLLAGIERAPDIFNIVFFISLLSVVIQGTTVPLAAKLLGVAEKGDSEKTSKVELELTDGISSEMMEVELPGGNPFVGKKVMDLGFPRNAIITMVVRNGQYLVPRGSTILNENDKLVILAEDASQFPALLRLLNIHTSGNE